MRIIIESDAAAAANRCAALIIDQIQKKPDSVLGLATGGTPVACYQVLIEMYQEKLVSFAACKSFNLDEYVGLAGDHPQSYRHFMQTNLFDHIDIDPAATHVPNGLAKDYEAYGEVYEQQIADAGGIDLQLLGIGTDGHIAFNEPGSSLGSRTRLKTLMPETVQDNARFFESIDEVPRLAVTMGVGTILESRQCLLMATGSHKADAIAAAIEGPVTCQNTASALQLHRDAIYVLDEAAASGLKRQAYYRSSEEMHRKIVEQGL
ncbi:Glucosamine-6-phosphate deaminase [Rosistilla ulvae]|uniref:Glucosamine-6-phosphate deaminase n=1 Tax=Rosistilla ulvae TaxID=1930277 RepID=A0A517M1T1_9BACT|nr:glucosamine-6-phosphate deaminase [Rosistilla ulvae]QDS88827.1 Glucosamine-6-phosphate deaminase [Rosistilla ulvae]